jgi:hypothetical protein
MPRSLPALSVCLPLLLLTAACGPGAADETLAFVLLDPHARQQGFGVEIDGEARSSPLPLAVPLAEGAPVVLTGPERREALDLEPGELAYIRGVNGVITRGNPDPDQIRIRGDEASVRVFAARVGVSPAPDGPSRWLLRGSGVMPMTAFFEDADAKDLFSSSPTFIEMRPESQPELSDVRAAAREAGGLGDGFVVEGRDGEAEALAAFFATRANGTAGRDPLDLARERAEIERDLEIKLSIVGPSEIRSSDPIELRAELKNRGLSERWLVKPDDGSSMGWREPYVFYSVKFEAEPGVWVDAPKERFGRCGNYDVRWDEDLVALPPGGVMPIEREILPIGYNFDTQAAGRYRVTAYYKYTGGAEGRGLFSFGEAVEVPPELFGTPTFEVASNPVEFTVTRPLDIEIHLKAPLVIGPATPLDSIIEATLVNRSGSDLPIPARSEAHGVRVEVESGGWNWFWFSGVETPPLSFARGGDLSPGDGVSLFDGVRVPVGEGWPAHEQIRKSTARIRASVWFWPYNDARHFGVSSTWIEVPVEWRGP